MSALDVRGLEVAYDGVPVLRHLDLTVESGVTAVLGRSGCGKTTLLRSVAGFVTPRGGSVAVAGRTVVGAGRPVPARERRLGYVPQEGGLFPHLDVAGNVTFGLPRARRRFARADVGELLELVELPATLARRYPHELSGGQQQRVALARALAPRPPLVLLDEPFSSLDAGLREETGRAVVRALRARDAAAVLVTHDQGEALSLADQVAVMHEGVFLQVGAPAEVYLSPADARVAAFLGLSVLLPGLARGRVARCALGDVAIREDASGPVSLAVRAEQVEVAGPGSGTPALVEEASFFGHDTTVRVRLGTGELVVARTPSGVLPVRGDRVEVRVVGEVVAFPRGEGDGS